MNHVCLGVEMCEECRAERRCQFYRCDDAGNVLSACQSRNTEKFAMRDGESVDLCSRHASWAAAVA